MTERSFAFGLNSGLIGTICQPCTSQSSGIGVILFNAGVVHRIGPHRFNVRLARELASYGISSIRFDLSGQGDSARSLAHNSFDKQIEVDVGAAIQALSSNTGLTQFALFGFCSGAYHGYSIAHSEKQLVGLLMFDAFRYPTIRSRLHRYLMRIKQHGLVRAVGGFVWRGTVTMGRRLVPNMNSATKPQYTSDQIYFTKYPTKHEFAASIGALVARGVKVGLIYTGDAFEHYNYEGQFRDSFGKLEIGEQVTAKYFPDMDHVSTGIAAQAELITYVRQWCVELDKCTRDG